MRTIHSWKGGELLPGPGTVFTLKHRATIEDWRDRLDVNSLTRAELTRLIRLNDFHALLEQFSGAAAGERLEAASQVLLQ
jgi:hypothetical protein